MAKEIQSYSINYVGTVGDTNPDEEIIEYTVRDTVDPTLTKRGSLRVSTTPEDVTWADAESRIKTEEGIS